MLKIEELKPGDVVYESQNGIDITTLVLTKPISDDDGWHFLGISENSVIPFFQAHKCGAYCLRLYRSPQYGNPTGSKYLVNVVLASLKGQI